ncbi:50S ribosomal protein L5 [Candidatus Curtissbacteria bacterium RIFCSPHIGHO2_01_FULL_41_11]|uniref:Large ribosomal subunit protein uL5 n=1 Tax=Candidatus Curtissbacteria bacterium RIFCSPHIGHO2_01_FULL_41_11 TaxID=1797711 RepID=A0A1F5G3I2_9BACT|nr:MAG: 50S ribosomal protein L5 [Candidatus Curtissbacteria bacterium RIFCSPHIGHO2_01_FULL_41_11]
MTNLQTKYKQEIMPKLKQEFNLKNDLAIPYVEKVVVNMGIAEAKDNKDILTKVDEQLATITGQKPKITRAKAAISTFKLREKDPIGMMVTLRGKKAWIFLEKLIAIVMPRMRDFRGLQTNKFDKMGNYSLGITEQILFPEIDYAKIDKIRGLVVSIVIKNSDPEKSKKLMELLGVPFRNN